MGLTVPLPDGYSLFWFYTQPKKMMSYIEDQLRWPLSEDPMPGDLMLFACRVPFGDHPAVYLGEGHMFHATAEGTTITPVNREWLQRLVKLYRPPLVSKPCLLQPPSPSAPSSEAPLQP